MSKTLQDLCILVIFTILLSFLVWLPFHLKLNNLYGLDFSAGSASIYRNFDGLEYIVIAKSLYDPKIIAGLPYALSANYYASHFPGYALLMLPFAPVLGFLKSMVLISLFFTVTSAIAFYFLVRDFKLTSHPLLLSVIFLILPARWLIVHSVGSAEPMFIFFTILAIYFFMKFEKQKKYYFIFLTGLAGFFAQFTRPPGILLFIALVIYLYAENFLIANTAPVPNLSVFN